MYVESEFKRINKCNTGHIYCPLTSVVDSDPFGSGIFGMLRYGSGTFFVSTTFYHKRYRRKYAMKIIVVEEGAKWK
jgi:hypothetical protein